MDMSLIDLAYEVGICPKKVADTMGGEYHSECPRCGGFDRFIIQPNKSMKNCHGCYWCRQCGIHGDAIQFCREFLGLSFKEAAARVNANIEKKVTIFSMSKKAAFKPVELISPPEKWLNKADWLVLFAHQEIWKHPDVLAWLKKRGIGEYAIKKFKLGWSEKDEYCSREDWGLKPELNKDGVTAKLCIPRGLVIPAIDPHNGNVSRIKIRRENCKKDDKFSRYIAFPGSMNGLSIFGDVRNHIMFVVESELDAIALYSVVGEVAITVAVGSNIKNPDNFTDLLAKQKLLLFICHDNDGAGSKMLEKWQRLYSHAQALPTLIGKDIGEAVELGLNLEQWIIGKLATIQNTN